MCMWDEKLSNDYEGKRFVVDGDIIELFAYEYGKRQTGVAEQFHAEPLEAYESGWLHDWMEHHDNMLRRTCDALESENAKLKRAAERDADVLESLNLSLEESQADNAKLREELAKWERLTAGIDIPEYPVTQFEPKDLERENEKLRELVADMLVCVREGDWDCSGYCPRYGRCDDGVSGFIDRARELGIEASE